MLLGFKKRTTIPLSCNSELENGKKNYCVCDVTADSWTSYKNNDPQNGETKQTLVSHKHNW